jgi:hypothetical protein
MILFTWQEQMLVKQSAGNIILYAGSLKKVKQFPEVDM